MALSAVVGDGVRAMTVVTLRRDMAAERARGRAALDAVFLPRIAALMSPAASVRSLKAAEAGRLLAGAIATSPLLAAEAKQRGLAESDLAAVVLAKAGEAAAEIAAIETQRQAAQAAIDAAASPLAINAIIERIS
jgi:hypothetical protein